MAVTIHTTPDTYTPSDNPVVWTFSSDQTAQDNFVYIVSVYVNDSLVANELRFPESGIYSRFDASSYASNNCNTPTISSSLYADAANYCTVRITVTERYGTPATDQASSAASNITCWKARMEDNDFIDWTPNDYILDGVASESWLTNYPSSVNPLVRTTNEEIRLMCINNLNNLPDFEIELYDSTDTLVNSYSILSVPVSANKITIFNLTPSVIIAASSITQADFDASTYMLVYAAGWVDQYRIDFDYSCVYSTYKRLHFLSTWGTIESHSFGLISRQMGDVKDYGYTKTFGEWSGSSFVFSKDQGREIDYAKTAELSLMCTSDWLSQAVQNYLQLNMKASPLIYQEDPDNSLMIRRRVRSKKLEWKIAENDMLFLETIEITLPSYYSAVI